MPRALEVLEHTLRQLERGEVSALEAIDALLGEELGLREGRRVKAALKMGRLLSVKTLASFDFAFQPSLDKSRILALAQLDFVDRHEVVHFLGQPGCGKTHVSTAVPDRRRYLSPGRRCRGHHPAVRAPQRLDDVTACPGLRPGLGESKEILAAWPATDQ